MKRLIIALWFTLTIMYAQQPTPVTPTAKCVIPFTFTTSGTHMPSTTGYDNRQTGCDTWTLQYSSTGFSVVSLLVESAPALSNNPPGTPNTYVTFAGSVSSGINPNTAITQAESTFSGFYPWMRITLTATGVGRVVGVLIGTNPSTNVNAIVVPSGTQDVNLIKVAGVAVVTGGLPGTQGVGGPSAAGAIPTYNPIHVAGIDGSTGFVTPLGLAGGYLQVTPGGSSTAMADGVSNTQNLPDFDNAVGGVRTFPTRYNGSTWDREFGCTNQAAFNLSGAGDTQIIALSGSTTIRICHISMSTTPAENIKITRGTGSNCGSGTTDVTGLYIGVTALAFDFTPQAPLKGAASGAICVNQSNAQATGGVVIYAQF